jgi:hypothetical protein
MSQDHSKAIPQRQPPKPLDELGRRVLENWKERRPRWYQDARRRGAVLEEVSAAVEAAMEAWVNAVHEKGENAYDAKARILEERLFNETENPPTSPTAD